MTTLPIEHAWLMMATGLHIHVHFLEVWPRTQERRGQVLYDRYRAAVHSQVPPLEPLRGRLPDGFLEHCYRQPGSADLSHIWEPLHFSGIATSIANTDVLVVEEGDCFVDGGRLRIVDMGRLPASAKKADTELQGMVSALIEATGLGFLVELNTKVVIHRGGTGAGMTEPVPDHEDFLCGTCEVFPEEGALAYAERLLGSAAAHWMYCFILGRPDPTAVAARRWDSPWSGEAADSIATAMQVFAHCIRLAFCERLLTQSAVAIGDSCREACTARVDFERARLKEMEEFVCGVEGAFAPADGSSAPAYNNMNVGYLLNTFYPGPRQFEKYWEGGGMGQYERG